MQALERRHPTRPPKAGFIERWESEYTRHGTLTLIANFEVATGQVITPSLGPTRTEEDFARHLAKTIDTDLEARWIFVLDQWNFHKSEALVCLVAERCELDVDLGITGKRGILQSMATCATLEDLHDRVLAFIAYFNATLAKPFKWTYKGRPLSA